MTPVGSVEACRAQAVATYSAAAASYGEIGPPIFPSLGRMLAERAELRPRMDVLDIGTGRGAALIPAVREIPGGRAVGIDLASEMVTRTRSRARSLGLRSTHFAVMDGAVLGFCDSSFDVVLAGFAVFWLHDALGAFREAVRVLRPGGRLVASMTSRGDDRWRSYDELL